MKLNKLLFFGLLFFQVGSLAVINASEVSSGTTFGNAISNFGSWVLTGLSTVFVSPGKGTVDYIQSPSGDIMIPDNTKYVALTLTMYVSLYKSLQIGVVERAKSRTISNFWTMGNDATLLDSIYSAYAKDGVKKLLPVRVIAWFASDMLTVSTDVVPQGLYAEKDDTSLVPTDLGYFIVKLSNDSYRFCTERYAFGSAQDKRSLHALHALAVKHLLFFDHASWLIRWVNSSLRQDIEKYKKNLAHNLGITEYKEEPAPTTVIQQAAVVAPGRRATLADFGRFALQRR